MPRVTIEYYGVEGSGRTVTEAKKDASEKIKASLTGNYHPKIIYHRGYAQLIYREPDGWHHAEIIDPISVRTSFGWTTGQSLEDVMKSAIMSLAHSGRHSGEFTCDLFDTLPRSERAKALSDFCDLSAFHDAYDHARKVLLLDEHKCHEWACQNKHRFNPQRSGDMVATA